MYVCQNKNKTFKICEKNIYRKRGKIHVTAENKIFVNNKYCIIGKTMKNVYIYDEAVLT